MWEKLLLSATITLILNLFVGAHSPSATDPHSNQQQNQAPIATLIK